MSHPDQYFGGATYSQHGEDLVLANLFKTLFIPMFKQRPAWLDLGAHHPENISNTRLLYELGYRGINVEANPNLMSAFSVARPEDINVNIGVGVREGVSLFYMFDAHSGLNTFSKDQMNKVKHIMPESTEIELQVTTVNKLVKDYCNGIWPPLLSVDIEGLDFEILLSADWSKSYPYIIVVETRREATANMVNMLNTRGFVCYCRMGENLIFIHKTQFPKVF